VYKFGWKEYLKEPYPEEISKRTRQKAETKTNAKQSLDK
jgi:hypothetical protein